MKPIQSFFEIALNKYLKLDPESLPRLHSLNHKVVTIELLGLGLILQLCFVDGKIQLQWDSFQAADTVIKGTPLSILHMTLTRGDRHHFFQEDVSIEGNLELGQEVIDLFDRLEIDWEEYLSHCVGDVPAHQLGRMVRGIKNFGERVRNTMLQNVTEYVHEEIDWFPPEEALQYFFSEIDELRMAIDRIDARVQRIRSSIK